MLLSLERRRFVRRYKAELSLHLGFFPYSVRSERLFAAGVRPSRFVTLGYAWRISVFQSLRPHFTTHLVFHPTSALIRPFAPGKLDAPTPLPLRDVAVALRR